MNVMNKIFLFQVIMVLLSFIICIIDAITIKLNMLGVFTLCIALIFISSAFYDKHSSKEICVYYRKLYKDNKEADFNLKAYLNFFIPLKLIIGVIFLVVGIFNIA